MFVKQFARNSTQLLQVGDCLHIYNIKYEVTIHLLSLWHSNADLKTAEPLPSISFCVLNENTTFSWDFHLNTWEMEMVIDWSGDREHAVWCQSPLGEERLHTDHSSQLSNQDVQIWISSWV